MSTLLPLVPSIHLNGLHAFVFTVLTSNLWKQTEVSDRRMKRSIVETWKTVMHLRSGSESDYWSWVIRFLYYMYLCPPLKPGWLPLVESFTGSLTSILRSQSLVLLNLFNFGGDKRLRFSERIYKPPVKKKNLLTNTKMCK